MQSRISHHCLLYLELKQPPLSCDRYLEWQWLQSLTPPPCGSPMTPRVRGHLLFLLGRGPGPTGDRSFTRNGDYVRSSPLPSCCRDSVRGRDTGSFTSKLSVSLSLLPRHCASHQLTPTPSLSHSFWDFFYCRTGLNRSLSVSPVYPLSLLVAHMIYIMVVLRCSLYCDINAWSSTGFFALAQW